MSELLEEFSLDLNGSHCTIRRHTAAQLFARLQEVKLVCVDSGVLATTQDRGSLIGTSSDEVISHKEQDYPTNNQATALRELVGEVQSVVVPAGERGKSKANFEMLLDMCFEHKLVRNDTIAVIGGGALCDTASFVASVYMRGVKLLLVPSTLLSTVDASIGGKTAINYGYWKNMVGTFYPPQEVLIASHLLETLNRQHLRDGLAEIIKAGMLCNDRILTLIESKGELLYGDATRSGILAHKQVWNELIWRAIQVKVQIVQEDFKEENVRAFLNLGHTFAHAHESCARYLKLNVSHGEAVGLGLRAALTLGMRICHSHNKTPLTDKNYANRIYCLLDILDYPKNYKEYSSRELVRVMSVDKKRNSAGLQFIVQSEQGNTVILPVEEEEVIAVLRELGAKE